MFSDTRKTGGAFERYGSLMIAVNRGHGRRRQGRQVGRRVAREVCVDGARVDRMVTTLVAVLVGSRARTVAEGMAVKTTEEGPYKGNQAATEVELKTVNSIK